jgi:gluconolactonase
MILADNLSVPEGPVTLPDRSWLVVEMGPERGCVTHISADGLSRRIITRTGRPNGLAVDQYGAIWVAESRNPPSLQRVSVDGQVEVFLAECRGEPFLFPNDLAIGPDEKLYMTDSGILYEDFLINNEVRPDYRTAKMNGKVYAIDVRSKTINVVDTGLQFANGIAFGPGGDLYVTETATGMVYRYRQEHGTIVGDREPFGNVIDPDKPDGWCGPDGMAFGANGFLYVAVYGQGDVTVLDRNGSAVQRIDAKGIHPTNVAFGADGEKRIYVTEIEKGVLLALDVDTGGLPLLNSLAY